MVGRLPMIRVAATQIRPKDRLQTGCGAPGQQGSVCILRSPNDPEAQHPAHTLATLSAPRIPDTP